MQKYAAGKFASRLCADLPEFLHEVIATAGIDGSVEL